MCLNIGTPKNHHFPFSINGKVVVFGVPILKHFRDYTLIFTPFLHRGTTVTGCLPPLRMRGSAFKGKNLVLWLMGEGGRE